MNKEQEKIRENMLFFRGKYVMVTSKNPQNFSRIEIFIKSSQILTCK